MKTALQWHVEEQAEAARVAQDRAERRAGERIALAEYDRRLRSCKRQLLAWATWLALCLIGAALLFGRLGR